MKNWYKKSITSLIEQFFNENGYNVLFDSSKKFADEVDKWVANLNENQKKEFIKMALLAREYAFNNKYGNYNYENDYRKECPGWNEKIILKILEYIPIINGKKIIGVGSNNGIELHQIFGNSKDVEISIVEISKDAIEMGRKLFPEFNFYFASMDTFIPKEKYYDIYLNLRAAYCAGNDLDKTVLKSRQCLTEDGLCVFSISNGYIDVENGERNIKKGIYNPITLECSDKETQINLNWVRDAIINNGFNNPEIYDIDSEILMLSKKRR